MTISGTMTHFTSSLLFDLKTKTTFDSIKSYRCVCIPQVRSRFAASSGTEDFGPFLAALQQLGFKLVKQDSKNKMFVVFVLKQQQQVHATAAGAIDWPVLKACVYKRR